MNDKDKEAFDTWDNLPLYQILSPKTYCNWLKLNDPHLDIIIDEFCRSAWQAACEYKEAENKKLREALMSSRSIKLASALRQLQNIRNVQKASTKTEDHYMVGLFNGIELAMSTITGKEPVYLNCKNMDEIKEELFKDA